MAVYQALGPSEPDPCFATTSYVGDTPTAGAYWTADAGLDSDGLSLAVFSHKKTCPQAVPATAAIADADSTCEFDGGGGDVQVYAFVGEYTVEASWYPPTGQAVSSDQVRDALVAFLSQVLPSIFG